MPDHERQKSGLIWSDDPRDKYLAPFYDHDWDNTMELAQKYPSGIDEYGEGIWDRYQQGHYWIRHRRSLSAKVVYEANLRYFGPNCIRTALEKIFNCGCYIDDWDKFMKEDAQEIAFPEFHLQVAGKWGIHILSPRYRNRLIKLNLLYRHTALIWEDEDK